MSHVKGLRENARKEAEHLFNDAWRSLEPQLLQFGRRLETCSEAALGELRGAGNQLRSNLEQLCQELRKPRPDAPNA